MTLSIFPPSVIDSASRTHFVREVDGDEKVRVASSLRMSFVERVATWTMVRVMAVDKESEMGTTYNREIINEADVLQRNFRKMPLFTLLAVFVPLMSFVAVPVSIYYGIRRRRLLSTCDDHGVDLAGIKASASGDPDQSTGAALALLLKRPLSCPLLLLTGLAFGYVHAVLLMAILLDG